MGIVACFYRTSAAKTLSKTKITNDDARFTKFLFFLAWDISGACTKTFRVAQSMSEENKTKEN